MIFGNIENKRDIIFQFVVALRDTLSFASKSKIKPTYEATLNILHDLDSELYDEAVTVIPEKNKSELVKYYIDEAQINSISSGETVSPIDLIQNEIDRLAKLLISAEINKQDKELESRRRIDRKILELEAAKLNLKPRKYSENRLLIRDFSKVDRKDTGAEYFEGNDLFTDYKISEFGYLRIRLLHPDIPEHITGADLIYEQHNIETNEIRFMFLQYKIWEDGTLYFSSSKNLNSQLLKMKSILCDKGFCGKPYSNSASNDYRFPYCCAFLRPTDKIQHNNEKLISSGIHIPVCSALEIKQANGEKIDKRTIRTQTLNHELFESLFNKSFIGSRWLKEDIVKDLYIQNKIIETKDTIKIFAREIYGVERSNEDLPF